MNKEKNDIIKERPCACGTRDEGLFLPKRQTGFMVVCALMLLASALAGAYFFGKKQAMRECMFPVEQAILVGQLEHSSAMLEEVNSDGFFVNELKSS